MVLIFALGFATTSHAGIVKENGGNSMVCDNGYYTTVELLDLYEARWSPANLYFKNMMTLNKNEVLKNVVGILTNVTGDNTFNRWLKDFDSNIKFVSAEELAIIPDTETIILDLNCKMQQTVVQMGAGYYFSRYKINFDLWKMMTPQHQAGLMIHEMVFGYLTLKAQLYPAAFQFSESEPVRKITAFLLSDEIMKMTLAQQKAALLKLNLISNPPIILEPTGR